MTSNQDVDSIYRTTGGSTVGGYPSGGYVPPEPPNTGSHAQDADPSTADVAKDQAASVAGGATDAAQHVAGVAKDQVGQVTAEAGRQVKDLLGQAQSELSDQAAAQQQKAAGGLRAVGDQLTSMAKGSEQSGVATDLAHQAGDKAHQIADWLENRDPGSVLDEVRSFARQRPGTFLAVALGAGLLAGRLARGLSADPEEQAAPTAGRPAGSAPTKPAPTAVGSGRQSALTGEIEAVPAADDLYGTGLVPDWTGQTPPSDGDR